MQENSKLEHKRGRLGVIELSLLKVLLWWCQQSKFKHTGARVLATVTRLMCGPSVSSSIRCSQACSFSMLQRRPHIRWLFSYCIARSRKVLGPGLKISRSASLASNFCARRCSRIQRSDHRGQKCKSTRFWLLSMTATKYHLTLSSIKNLLKVSSLPMVKSTSTQRILLCIKDCIRQQWRDSSKKTALVSIKA